MSGSLPAHRGFMLDVSRHFMPVENIRRLLKAAQLCGLNIMHWHLADDQAWRVEIKKYPRLTEVGSVRGDSYFGNVSATENNCGFYTQEEIRDIVSFAAELGIDIIPEIEIPGHASAMLTAYPEYGCRRTVLVGGVEEIVEQPYDYAVRCDGGIFPNLICAGRDDSIDFFKDILTEIIALFPYPAVHIGGDEALKLHWRRCPDCRRRMREEGLANEEELQRRLVLTIGEFLAQHGRSTIVYNDCLSGGLLPQHFIVHHWLGNDKETAEFMRTGGRVIRSDLEDFYFDYSYSSIDVEHIRNMASVPAYAEGCEDKLIGYECMLWTERITNIDRAAYLLFPRLPAMALKMAGRCGTWEEFCAELRSLREQLSSLGLEFAPEKDWKLSPEDAEADREHDHYLRYSEKSKLAEEEEIRLLQQEELEKLLAQIDMPREFAMQVMDHAWKDLPGYSGAYSSDVTNGADKLAAHLLAAIDNRDEGCPWENIPEIIWLDTMKAFTRFVNEHHASTGEYGFDRDFWTTRQVNAQLLRIGELEYEMCQHEGRDIISLHIPSDADMSADKLNTSVSAAREFIAEWYPQWAQAPMVCSTWLPAPALRDMLPGNANIIRFQNAFDILEVDPEPDDVLEWVFRLTEEQQKNADISALPENTTLQREVKKLLLSGGRVGIAGGVLAREFE